MTLALLLSRSSNKKKCRKLTENVDITNPLHSESTTSKLLINSWLKMNKTTKRKKTRSWKRMVVRRRKN